MNFGLIIMLIAVAIAIFFFLYCWGGFITGIIFQDDAPVDHKICWVLSSLGVLIFSIIYVFIF